MKTPLVKIGYYKILPLSNKFGKGAKKMVEIILDLAMIAVSITAIVIVLKMWRNEK